MTSPHSLRAALRWLSSNQVRAKYDGASCQFARIALSDISDSQPRCRRCHPKKEASRSTKTGSSQRQQRRWVSDRSLVPMTPRDIRLRLSQSAAELHDFPNQLTPFVRPLPPYREGLISLRVKDYLVLEHRPWPFRCCIIRAKMIFRRPSKSHVQRLYLLDWWRKWESGYRGPMPYVIGPGWRPPGGTKIPRSPRFISYDERRSL